MNDNIELKRYFILFLFIWFCFFFIPRQANREQATGLRNWNCHCCHCLKHRLPTRANISCDLRWWMESYHMRETTDYKSFLPCVCGDLSAPAYSWQQQRFIPTTIIIHKIKHLCAFFFFSSQGPDWSTLSRFISKALIASGVVSEEMTTKKLSHSCLSLTNKCEINCV